MNTTVSILSSLAMNHKPKEMWKTTVRCVIRILRRQGKSYREIKKETGLERSTVQGICKGASSRTTRKAKATKPRALKKADIRLILRFISAS